MAAATLSQGLQIICLQVQASTAAGGGRAPLTLISRAWPCNMHNSWQKLAVILGVENADLKCIGDAYIYSDDCDAALQIRTNPHAHPRTNLRRMPSCLCSPRNCRPRKNLAPSLPPSEGRGGARMDLASMGLDGPTAWKRAMNHGGQIGSVDNHSQQASRA